MRRVYRGELPLVARLELFRRGKSVTSVSSAQASWTSYRRSLGADAVLGELRRMAGPRGRCFYCSDSWGADVDHFVPIARQVGSTFSWRNMLWVCPTCNRKKGRRFPTGPDGQPLMIDPTRVDPWLHLILDTSTGVLAPRFLSDGPDPKGNATLTVLQGLSPSAATGGSAPTWSFTWTACPSASWPGCKSGVQPHQASGSASSSTSMASWKGANGRGGRRSPDAGLGRSSIFISREARTRSRLFSSAGCRAIVASSSHRS